MKLKLKYKVSAFLIRLSDEWEGKPTLTLGIWDDDLERIKGRGINTLKKAITSGYDTPIKIDGKKHMIEVDWIDTTVDVKLYKLNHYLGKYGYTEKEVTA